MTPAPHTSWLPTRPCTLWLTGLPGSGKSTLGDLAHAHFSATKLPCVRLDGDALRSGLNADLGFSATDRKESVRRTAQVARLFNLSGTTVIVSLVSPFSADRLMASQIIGLTSFIEVFVDSPLAVCEARDPKGMYRRARADQIADFTGVSSAYEPPMSRQALRVDTASGTPQASLDRLLALLADSAV
jgi:adenylyl-sulfate kinase